MISSANQASRTITAAALSLGFAAIGRPSCSSCVRMTNHVALDWQEVVIIGDIVSRLNAIEKVIRPDDRKVRLVIGVFPGAENIDELGLTETWITHQEQMALIQEESEATDCSTTRGCVLVLGKLVTQLNMKL
ncbi:hypothetical protein ACFL3F_02065 [Planctomycetota bacterium]